MKVFSPTEPQNLLEQRCLPYGVRGGPTAVGPSRPAVPGCASNASLRGAAPSLPARRGLPGSTWRYHAPPAPRRRQAWACWRRRGLQMAGHLASREAVRAGAPYPAPSPRGASSSSLLGGAGGRFLSPPRPLGSSGHPGVCRVCIWPQGPAWTGLCRCQEKCDYGASRARRTLRTGPGPNPSLPPAPPPAACHLPPGGRGGS